MANGFQEERKIPVNLQFKGLMIFEKYEMQSSIDTFRMLSKLPVPRLSAPRPGSLNFSQFVIFFSFSCECSQEKGDVFYSFQKWMEVLSETMAKLKV